MIQLPSIKLPGAVRGDLQRYFEAEWRGGDAQVLRCDVILALLRLGHRDHVESLLGKPITVLPPAVPPWPPKPVAREVEPVVRRVGPSNLLPVSRSQDRFRKVRVGMTESQLRSRGITKRDVRYWTSKKILEMS